MSYLILITLVGISFAPFILNKLDIWHAQGIWTQVGILACFAWSFASKPVNIKDKNLPLCLLVLWTGILTTWICYQGQVNGVYNIKTFLPFFNLVCLLILYKCIVQYLNIQDVLRIMNALRWVLIATILMATLQFFGLDQFFKLFDTSDHWHANKVVGFIGNGTHLSGFLASMAPLLLLRFNRTDKLALALLFIILCLSGTSLQDASLSGFVILFCLISWHLLSINRVWFFIFIGAAAVLGMVTYGIASEDTKRMFFQPHGRFEIWQYYWNVFAQNQPITGLGLGAVEQMYERTPFKHASKVHLEYLQFAVEIGLIGILFILNLIVSFVNHRATGVHSKILKLMVYGFLLSCLFNFPAHLWLPSTIAIFCYASYRAIESQGVNPCP